MLFLLEKKNVLVEIKLMHSHEGALCFFAFTPETTETQTGPGFSSSHKRSFHALHHPPWM
jgi:hypothetical protein